MTHSYFEFTRQAIISQSPGSETEFNQAELAAFNEELVLMLGLLNISYHISILNSLEELPTEDTVQFWTPNSDESFTRITRDEVLQTSKRVFLVNQSDSGYTLMGILEPLTKGP